MAGLEGRFHGTCALVRVQLMRAASTNDVEAALANVRERGLITSDDAELVRACFSLDERMHASGLGSRRDAESHAGASESDGDELLSLDTIARLHMIVSTRLNVADSA